MQFNVDASKLKLAATCKAVDDIRYYLNGVLIEPRAEGGVYMVGTDGHRMMVVIDESGSIDQARIIRVEKDTLKRIPKIGYDNPTMRAVAASVANGQTLCLIGADEDTVHIQTEGLEIDGTFPNWRKASQVKQNAMAKHTGVFNFRLLADVKKAFSKDIYFLAIELYAADQDMAIAVRFCNYEFAQMVVMPMRDDSDKAKWMDLWTKPSALYEKRNADIDLGLSTAFSAFASFAALEEACPV